MSLPTQKGVDTRQKFLVVEGLGQVVIRSGVQSLDSVLYLALCCEHQDRS